jgi:hypothetical protein
MVQQTRQAMLDPIDYDDAPRARPLSAEQRDRCISRAIDYLDRAASGDRAAVAEAMARALCLLTVEHSPITARQRDDLLRSLFLARPRIVDLFDTPERKELIADCFDGVAALIIARAKPFGSSLPSYVVMRACARFLQNSCHCIALAHFMVEQHAALSKAS